MERNLVRPSGSACDDVRMSAEKKKDLLDEADRLREGGRPEEARERLLALTAEYPDDAEVACRTAWIHDALGLESEAVPYYERALANPGLSAQDRRGSLLGLGSTYRVLGRYGQGVETLRRGVEEFPDDGAMRTFLAMALFNTGEHDEAMRLLLELTAATSQDPYVQQYRRAIEHYAKDLHETV
ncbi:Tetratrico peptide repeat-containing protein [Streptomyces sp. Cmuel-A718b]|nr:Tetratrico peptide repeat-containing protein [Streptomyces sp. Cmuel-A718b]